MMDKRLFELHAEVCKTLANPKRIEVINTLRNREMCVGELAAAMGIAKANLSQHLAIMRDKGIVTSRREGVNVLCRIANPKVIQACDLMRQVLVEQLVDGEKLVRGIAQRE